MALVRARSIRSIRETRKRFEREVESVETLAGERIGQARFAVYGKSAYPDATFTLRLSYGTVKGYPMNGTQAPWCTTLPRSVRPRVSASTASRPYDLPARYIVAQGRRSTLATPFNFVTTNDIIGGNSGSPVVNRKGELVGLVFDGNIESLVGNFVYDDRANRTVAVHSAAIVHSAPHDLRRRHARRRNRRPADPARDVVAVSQERACVDVVSGFSRTQESARGGHYDDQCK